MTFQASTPTTARLRTSRCAPLRSRAVRGAAIAMLAVGFAAAFAPSARAQGKENDDTVRLKDGKTVTGRIESEDFASLTVKGKPAVTWDQVASIEYGNAPEFTKAVELYAVGSLEEAQVPFEEIKKDEKERKVLRQQALYYLPLIARRSGAVDDAIAGWNELIKAFPGGRYHAVAAENLVSAHLAKNDAAGASSALDKAIEGAGKDEVLAAQLNLLKARVLVGQGKFAEARAVYEAAANAGNTPPAVKFDAQLGRAYCLQREGNRAEAEAKYRELVAADAPNHVLAGAWNGLGELAEETGRQKRDIDQLLEAVLCHLRGCTVYPATAGESDVEYERALAGSGLCFKAVADLETNAERKRLYNDRALERKNQLAKEFPNSPYLEKF
jgi:tetratricopeptide (TPR) repeat protein